jgi:hypothetical protein
MTIPERNALLAAAVPVVEGDLRSRRFALRRTTSGLEIFDIKYTRDVEGEPEFHGHPATRVDRRALKVFRDIGAITEVEYNRLRKELPGC